MVIYDSVTNSVFDGQVMHPLLQRLHNEPHLHITFVSYERNKQRAQDICSKHEHPRLSFHILTQLPFIGTISLRYAANHFKKVVPLDRPYELLARGPLAGWICLHAYNPSFCTKITVQARGLLAAEYRYMHRTTYGMSKIWHGFRLKQCETIEQEVYGNPGLLIEVVSPALKAYIHETYGARLERISIAKNDIPAPITSDQRIKWRAATREQLSISTHAHVYCYNGSLKPWQCPDETIIYFKKQLDKNPESILLILSHDESAFKAALAHHALDPQHYRVCSVSHKDVYQYLSAADTGLLFREKDIVNWVSRPTKLLEYQAVGLNVVHNNTIEYVTKQPDGRE